MNEKEQRKEFDTLVKPVIRFLNDNYNPHTKVIIDPTCAEIVSGEMFVYTEEFILD